MVDGAESRSRTNQSVIESLRGAHQRVRELFPKPDLPADSIVHSRRQKILKRETAYGTTYVMVTTASSPADGSRNEQVDLWFVDPRFDDGDPFWSLNDDALAGIDQIPDVETNPRISAALEHLTALADGEFQPVTNYYEFPRASN